MPRSQKRAISQRKEVPSAERRPKSAITFNPQASPVDPYDGGAAGYSPGTADLLGSLQGLQSIAKNAQPLAELYGTERQRMGAEARAQGQERDESAGNAFLVGYDKLDGEYKGVEHRIKMKAWAQENSHLPPDEFNAGLQAEEQAFVDSLTTDRQLDAASPYLLQGNADATSIYSDVKTKEVLADRDAKTYKVVQEGTDAIVNEELDKFGITRQGLLNDPAQRKLYSENRVGIANAVGPRIREMLSKKQAEWRALGMTPKQISAKTVEVVGALAEELGIPELLAFAVIPDKDGITVEQADPKAFNLWNDRATAANTRINNEMWQQKERERTELWRANESKVVVDIDAVQTVEQAEAARKQLRAMGESGAISPEFLRSALNELDVRMQGGGHIRTYSDQPTVDRLWDDYFKGKLTPQKVLEAGPMLRREDSTMFRNMIKADMDKSKADHPNKIFNRNTYNMYDHGMGDALYPGYSKGLAKVDINAEDNIQYARDKFTRGYAILVQKYGGEENIPADEITKLRDGIVHEHRSELVKNQAPGTGLPAQRHPNYQPTPGSVLPPIEEEEEVAPPTPSTGAPATAAPTAAAPPAQPGTEPEKVAPQKSVEAGLQQARNIEVKPLVDLSGAGPGPDDTAGIETGTAGAVPQVGQVIVQGGKAVKEQLAKEKRQGK